MTGTWGRCGSVRSSFACHKPLMRSSTAEVSATLKTHDVFQNCGSDLLLVYIVQETPVIELCVQRHPMAVQGRQQFLQPMFCVSLRTHTTGKIDQPTPACIGLANSATTPSMWKTPQVSFAQHVARHICGTATGFLKKYLLPLNSLVFSHCAACTYYMLDRRCSVFKFF